MDDLERDALRRLASWLSRRRAVDEALSRLTAHGPAALEQVHAHLDALRRLLALEREAFDAVERAAPGVPQLDLAEAAPDAVGPGTRSATGPGTATALPAPGPVVELDLDAASRTPATVHSLQLARERHLT